MDAYTSLLQSFWESAVAIQRPSPNLLHCWFPLGKTRRKGPQTYVDRFREYSAAQGVQRLSQKNCFHRNDQTNPVSLAAAGAADYFAIGSPSMRALSGMVALLCYLVWTMTTTANYSLSGLRALALLRNKPLVGSAGAGIALSTAVSPKA